MERVTEEVEDRGKTEPSRMRKKGEWKSRRSELMQILAPGNLPHCGQKAIKSRHLLGQQWWPCCFRASHCQASGKPAATLLSVVQMDPVTPMEHTFLMEDYRSNGFSVHFTMECGSQSMSSLKGGWVCSQCEDTCFNVEVLIPGSTKELFQCNSEGKV